MDTAWTRRGRVVAMTSAVVAALCLFAWIAWPDRNGEGESGAGLDYGGRFYFLSSAEVRAESLGRVVERDVAFQDTEVDLRSIDGVDARRALAAYTRTFPGTGTNREMGWLLLSPNAEAAADPSEDPELRGVIRP